VSTGVTEMGR